MKKSIERPRDDYFVYFFIPLPEAIGLPVGGAISFGIDEEPSGLLAPTAPGGDLGAGVGSYCHLVVHKLEWTQPAHGIDDHLTALIESTLPWLTSRANRPATSPETLLAALTLVEVAVLIHDPDEGVTDAFDEALAAIRTVQKAYYAVTKAPTTLVRREGLPFLVSFAIAKVQGESAPVEHQGIGLFHCHDHPQFARDELEFDGPFHSALHLVTGGGPMNAYLEVMREARVADELRGEYKTAAIYYASAAEVFLHDLLLHLMWEEGMTPQQASDEFDSVRAGLRSRVRSLYRRRLKGGWDLKRDPLRAWDIDAADLRNRAVHAAYEPTVEECRASRDALIGLEKFVCDRLASNAILPKYPRTALALMAEQGLRRRDAYSRAVRQLAEDKAQPIWRDRFELWRERFTLIRRETDGKDVPRPDIEDTDLSFVCRDGSLTWVRRHHRSRRAVVVELVDERAVTEVLTTAIKMASIDGFVGSSQVAPTIETKMISAWVWDSELIPEAEDGPTY